MTSQEIEVLASLLSYHCPLTPELATKRIRRKLRDERITHPAPPGTTCPTCRDRTDPGKIVLRWHTASECPMLLREDGWCYRCEACGTCRREEG